MKKRIAALLLSVFCLLSVVGCSRNDVNNDPKPSASQPAAVEDDYLTTIGGTYVELFPELSKAEYRSLWHEATAAIVGEENADAATDMLLAMCMAEPYGKDAIDAYTENPESMAFNCYFLGGVEKFVIDGHTITGFDKDGKEVFSHKYKLLDVENETLIQTALSRLIKNKTVLIIAHRMRTVAGADKIVVLSDGVVAEQGSPSELYAQNGIYTHMADLQTQGQNWTI